jgi:hypothetical protein
MCELKFHPIHPNEDVAMNHQRTAVRSWARNTALIALLPMLAATAWADDVEQVRAAESDARIEFSGVTGDFYFVGSSSNQLEITGTLGE